MAVKNSVKAIVLSSIDSATFTGAFQLLSASAGISNACFMIRIVNNSNVDVIISYDGTNNNDFVPKNTVAQLAFQTNAQPNTFIANLSQGTKIYVNGAAGMGNSGLVYLAGYYQPQGS